MISDTDSISEIKLVRISMMNIETGGNQVRKISKIINQGESYGKRKRDSKMGTR